MVCLIVFDMLSVVHHHSASSSNCINSGSMCLFVTCSMWAASPQRISYPKWLSIPRLLLLITPQTLHLCLQSAAEVTGLSKLNILSTLSQSLEGSTILISRYRISRACRVSFTPLFFSFRGTASSPEMGGVYWQHVLFKFGGTTPPVQRSRFTLRLTLALHSFSECHCQPTIKRVRCEGMCSGDLHIDIECEMRVP